MRKNMLRTLLFSAAMSFCLISSASVAFAQCGADGTQPCPTQKKTVPESSPAKKAVKPAPITPKKVVLNQPKPQTPRNNGGNAARAEALAKQSLNEVIKGNFSSAKDLTDEALRLNANLPLALAISGWAKENLGNNADDYQPAAADLEKAVRFEPSNGLFHARLGIVYESLKRNTDAEAEFNRGILWLESPKNAIEYYARAICKKELNKSDEAIQDYTAAISLNLQFVLAYNNRGRLYHNKKDYDAAIRDYNRAIEINPQYAWAYYNRGDSYSYKNDNDAAIRSYTEAIRINPRFISAYIDRGLSYNIKEDYDAAIKDFNEAIKIDPREVLAHKFRGDAYFFYKKDYDAAIKDYNRAIEIDAQFSLGYSGRGLLYFYKKDYDAAVKDYSRAIEINPKGAITYKWRGDAYFYKKDYSAAIKDYTKAIEINPQNSYAYDSRAEAYDAIGRKDLAEADRKKYRELGGK